MVAGRSLTLQASQARSSGALHARAGGDLILNASRGCSAGRTANAFASVTAVCGQKPPQTYDNNRQNTCPEPRVKWASPKGLPASPLFTRVSGLPARKRPIDAGFRPGDAYIEQ